MRNDDFRKCVTPGVMIELMRQLPTDVLVLPNAVGNLVAVRKDGDSYVDVAFVDLASESVEIL